VPWETRWKIRFDELVRYKAKYENCDVPKRQGTLGMWADKQRTTFKNGELAQDRIDRLNGIGFDWTPPRGYSRKGPTVPWETRFNELAKYKAKHGGCDVPKKQGKLGPWVGTQRTAYRRKTLAQEHINRLNGIGFDWAPPRGYSRKGPTVPWETRFNELVKYKAKHGDCDVPAKQGKLGSWAGKQRTTYKNGKLAQDRIDRLNGIGFDWAPPRGGSRKRRALPSAREESSSRQMRVPPPCVNVQSLCKSEVEPDGVKGQGFGSKPSLPLRIPSSTSNHKLWTESDDEVDEIGALIYDQVMRNKESPNEIADQL